MNAESGFRRWRLLSVSATLPDYLTDEDRQRVAAMRKNAENRLDDLVVEGLLARYRQLSFELQKAFLRMGWKSNRKSAPVALQSHFPVYISFGKD